MFVPGAGLAYAGVAQVYAETYARQRQYAQTYAQERAQQHFQQLAQQHRQKHAQQPAAAQAGTAPGEDLNSAALYHSLKPASPPTPEDDDMDIAQDSPTHNVAATKPGTTALSGAAAVAAAAAAAAPAALAAAARDAPKTIPAATLPPVPQVQAGCLDGAEASGATRRALVPPSVPRQASPTYVPRPVVRDASKRDGPMISTETSDFLAKIAAKRRAEGHIVEVVGAVASASNPAPERAVQDPFGAGGGPACRGPDAWGAEGRRDSWGWERGRDPALRDTLQGMRGHGQEDSGDRHGVAGADRNTCSARQSNFSDGPPPQFCAAELGHVARESVPTDGYHAEYQHAGGFTGGNQLPPSHSVENAGGGAWGLNGFDIRTDTGVGGHPATATQLGANPQIEAVTEAEAFYPGGGAFDDADGLDVDDENSQGVARLKRYVIAAVKETIQPYYAKREMTKEQFKDVAKKATAKITNEELRHNPTGWTSSGGLKEFMAHGRGKNIHKIVKAYVMIVKGKKEKTMRRQAGAKDEAGDSAGKEVHGTLDPSTMQQVHSGGGPGD